MESFNEINHKEVLDRGYADIAALTKRFGLIKAEMLNLTAKTIRPYYVVQFLYLTSSQDLVFEPEDIRRPIKLRTSFYIVERERDGLVYLRAMK